MDVVYNVFRGRIEMEEALKDASRCCYLISQVVLRKVQ